MTLGVTSSIRCRGLRSLVAVLSFSLLTAIAGASATANTRSAIVRTDPAFAKFVADLWPLAQAHGVSQQTFDRAFKGVSFDSRVVALSRNQAEFSEPVWQYLASAVSDSRIERGRAHAKAESAWLDKARDIYGVDPSIIMGIWGMETEFGAFQGSNNVVRALTSLAYVHFRGDYFRDELISALVILEDDDVSAAQMVGSWAGAMGQTQFMPSSFLNFAIDFDGKGKRNIWTDPADAIGSTANYLSKQGWTRGLPWGFEVRLPADFKLKVEDTSIFAPFTAFAQRGVTRADNGAMPAEGAARLLIPSGLGGPVFLVTANFKTIKSYNNSTSYALGVALLGDAIMGKTGLHTPWPVRDKTLTQSQVRELQSHLQKLGYDVGEIDGRTGDVLQAAVRTYQEKNGMPPDGYATSAILEKAKHQH
jgi:membrane-bound lytic murein transglycosylase B